MEILTHMLKNEQIADKRWSYIREHLLYMAPAGSQPISMYLVAHRAHQVETEWTGNSVVKLKLV